MFDAISSRRSCRSFDSNKPVPKEAIDHIIKTALNSPTGCDFQSYDFLVVTNKDKLYEVAKCVAESLKDNEMLKHFVKTPEQIFYGAPLVIFIVPAREFREDCYQYDLGIIGNSICLAAQLQGLSSVQVGFVQHAKVELLSKILELPRNLNPLAVAIGYANPDWVPKDKSLTSSVKYID